MARKEPTVAWKLGKARWSPCGRNCASRVLLDSRPKAPGHSSLHLVSSKTAHSKDQSWSAFTESEWGTLHASVQILAWSCNAITLTLALALGHGVTALSTAFDQPTPESRLGTRAENPSSHRRTRRPALFSLHRLCVCADCFRRWCQLDTWSIPPIVSPSTIGTLATMLHTLVVMLPLITGSNPDEQRIEGQPRPLTTAEGFYFGPMLPHVSS